MPSTQESTPRKTFRVRSYTSKDHQDAVELFVEGVKAYPENQKEMQPNWVKLIEMSVKGDLADIQGVYFAKGGHYWVATCELEDGTEEVVGTIGLEAKPGNVGELRRLTVKPSYHRCGIGRLLVSALEQWAKENGFNRITLGTGKVVVAARRFYESVGYTNFDSVTYGEAVVCLYEKHLE